MIRTTYGFQPRPFLRPPIATAPRFAEGGESRGDSRRAPATDPPEILEPLDGLPEGFHSVFYMMRDEEQNRLTLYYHTHPDHQEEVRQLGKELGRKLRAIFPGATVAIKPFEERPINAIVL